MKHTEVDVNYLFNIYNLIYIGYFNNAISIVKLHDYILKYIYLSEKKKLKDIDCPLWERLLQGPSGSIARMFLMDREAEEISGDVSTYWNISSYLLLSYLKILNMLFVFLFRQVAQYIKFNLPLLENILQRLNEEEEREIQRTVDK